MLNKMFSKFLNNFTKIIANLKEYILKLILVRMESILIL